MAARMTSRRMGEFLALWLCAWLVARECLLVFFDFSPLKLVFISGITVLILRLWLYNRRSRLIGAGVFASAALILGLLPADSGAGVQFSAFARYCSGFVSWIQMAYSSPDLVLHERFGVALWMIFVIGAALAAVLFLDTFRMPVIGALLFCVLFSVLQVAPFVINRDNTRLLITLVIVIACCIWFYIGKKYDSSRRTRSYIRWQSGMALLLLPAILLTTATAGRSDMEWRSGFLSGGVEVIAERMAGLFSRPGGGSGVFLNSSVVKLGGNRIETGAPCLRLKLYTNSNRDRSVYLRTSVFDRYTGYQWQRTLDENSYPAGSKDFTAAVRGPQESTTSLTVQYELTDFTYHSKRIPTPLGVTRIASAKSGDVEDMYKKSGKAKDFILCIKSDPYGTTALCARWNKKTNGNKTLVEKLIKSASLTANDYGEINSDITVRSQTVVGYLFEDSGSYYDVGKQNSWSAGQDRTLSRMTFGELAKANNYDAKARAYVKPYLDLPAGLPPEVRALADRLKGNGPYETANNIRDYLRKSYTYTLRPESSDRDFVASFLFDIKEGYCTYYASAMAVLARACGIPSRYVEGYAVSHERAKEGVTLRDGERHAWTELCFPEVGWLTYDATAYSHATGAPIPREALDLKPYLHNTEEEEEEKPEPEQPKPEKEDKPKTPQQQTDKPEAGKAKAKMPASVKYLLAAVLTAAALYLFYRLRFAAWMRTQARYQTDPKYVLAAYSELLRSAKALGCGRRPAQTVQDFFIALAALGLSESSCARCISAACGVDAALYGGKDPSEAEMRALADVLASTYQRILNLRNKAWFTLWWRRGNKDAL